MRRLPLLAATSPPQRASLSAETAQRPVQVRPAIAKYEPVIARAPQLFQVEAGCDDLFRALSGLGEQRAAGIGDERGTIEAKVQSLRILQRILRADAVAGNERHQVCGRMALLR